MSLLLALSHVADVGALGQPYIGEGPWAASRRSSRTSWRLPERRSNSGMSFAESGRPAKQPTARGRSVPAQRTARSWPTWSSLRGRKHRDPRAKVVREQ